LEKEGKVVIEHILIVREAIIKFFKRFEAFIMPILKFLLGLFVFMGIQSMGQPHAIVEPLTGALEPMMLTVLLAVLFTVVPMNLGWIMIILSLTMQFSAHMEVAIAVFLFLLFIFIFYARMARRESILILFTILAFHFNVPYLIPLIVGLYFPVTAVIPVTVGVFINAQIPLLFNLTSPAAATNIPIGGDVEITELLTELPGAFSEIYATLLNTLTITNWVFTAVIFAMVIVLVHFVSRMAIDYSREIAIALGCVMNIFGFVVSVFVAGGSANIGMIIAITLLCGVLALIMRFFDSILDYQRAESVQFEDDNNFYHVRIVPKVIRTKSQRVVKRIRPDGEAQELEGAQTRSPRPMAEPADPDMRTRPMAEPKNPAMHTRPMAEPKNPDMRARPMAEPQNRPRPPMNHHSGKRPQVQQDSDGMPMRPREAPRHRRNPENMPSGRPQPQPPRLPEE